MENIEAKIFRAIQTNKLNLNKLGGRNWYNYFIHVSELRWSINLHDGYKIEVYTEK